MLNMFLLSNIVIFTFIPVLYKLFPFLGYAKIVLVSGIFLLLSYIGSDKKNLNASVWNNKIFISLTCFVAVTGLGLLVSLDRGLTLSIFLNNFKFLLVAAIMVKIINTEERFDYILYLFGLCGLCMAVSLIYNYYSGYNFKDSSRGEAISSGIFADPNDMALFLNTILPFLFYAYAKMKQKFIILIAIITVEVAVILTYSRGGFLGSCLILASTIFFMKSHRLKLLTVITIFLSIFLILSPQEYKDRLATIVSEAQVDSETGKYPGRAQAWLELAPIGFETPVLGHGAGCSYYLAGNRDSADWVLVHNSYLQVFLETGLVGLLFYLSIFVLPFYQYFSTNKISRHVEFNKIRNQFALVSLIGYAATAMFLPQGYSPIVYFLSAIFIIQHELNFKQKSNAIVPA